VPFAIEGDELIPIRYENCWCTQNNFE